MKPAIQANTSAPQKSGEVRSLVRGLRLLTLVNELAPASVSDLVKASTLPKATTIRLLATLRESGYVRQDSVSGRYEPLPAVLRLSGGLHAHDGFSDLAKRQLNEFGQQVNWPAELMMAESDAMVILASNRETSPIQLRLFEQRRFPVLRSAGGLAWISALPARERESVLARLCALDAPAEPAQDAGNDLLTEARNRVDRVRRAGYSRQLYEAPVPGMQAIGVPIMAARKSVGALVLLTLQSVVPLEQMEQQLLPPLKETAAALGHDYATRTAF